MKCEDWIEDERFKTAIDRFKNVSERKQLTAEAISIGPVTRFSSD